MRALALVVVIACARPIARPDGPDLPSDRESRWTIWLGGARVGTAIERETWRGGAVTLWREETMRFVRGDATIALDTTLEIHASAGLIASSVDWRERSGPVGATPGEQHASATRDEHGWHTADGQTLPADAVPAELASLVMRRDHRFHGRVFLPARGFLGGTGTIAEVAPSRLIARLTLDGGAAVEATIDVDADGNYTRIVDGDGVIALRVTAARADAPFQPVDLIAATSIPIAGTPTKTLMLDGGIAVPGVPGQLARPEAGGVALELSSKLPGDLPYGVFGRDRSREITQLVSAVRARIAPDLAAHPGSPRDAATATAGDCTTFALAYTALATARSIPTRVVTGMRIDHGRLIRHRWAISWTGKAWIAVDAAFGAVPAGGDLVGLALHGADDGGLVAGEAALAQVRSASWR